MSTRTVSVKAFNHVNKQQQQHHNNSNVAQLKPIATVSKASNHKNHNTNQQPKKTHPKVQASKNNNHQKRRNNNNKKLVEDDSSSSSSSSSSEDDQKQQQPARRSNKRISSHQHHHHGLADQVYAGPTFNNAPAPSALPIPAFNARGSPINYPQPLYINPSLQQQSMDLMNLITPPKVVAAYEMEKTNLALSEIQRGLRSMLKIES